MDTTPQKDRGDPETPGTRSDPGSESGDGTKVPSTLQGGIPVQIGHFHVKRIIAQGGMGTVYEAAQEKPRRVVALKVMKAGLASRSALRRFEYESQLLARLRHSGIAQVYEAGTHDDGSGGVPYFAMEYIAGARSVTEYAEFKNLNTAEKLELFMKVCDAVHHGHQKGIIHRDLKPQNILVDSTGQPKVIDFGIARAADSDQANTALQTQVGDLVGTVQYMSPEQCDADPHDLDTRSDVYALGMVLYQLLCKQLPYDVTQVGILEATRIIKEKVPTPLGPINSDLKGDIETIVQKALAKDRERRYQSANALRSDIERYILHEPISARPPSITYHLTTFARRNKPLVGAGIAVVLALIAGFITTSIAMVKAVRAEKVAEAKAATAGAVTGYFQEMFAGLDPHDGKGHHLTVVEFLDDAAAEAEPSFADEPEVKATVHATLGAAYLSLSNYREAETQLETALAIQRRLPDVTPEDLAETLQNLGTVKYFTGRGQENNQLLGEAETLYREAYELRCVVFGEESREAAGSKNYVAAAVDKQKRHTEAEPLFREVLTTRKLLYGERDHIIARTVNNLATCLLGQERFDEAEARFREALTIAEFYDTDLVGIASAQSNLAYCLTERSREEADDARREAQRQEAEQLFRASLQVKLDELRAPSQSIAMTQHRLAELLHDIGQDEEAEQLVREALETRRIVFADKDTRTCASADLLATILMTQGRWDDALVAMKDVVSIRRLLRPDGHWEIALDESRVGECLARLGERHLAQERLEDSYLVIKASYESTGEDDRAREEHVVEVLMRLIDLFDRWGKPDQVARYRVKLPRQATDASQ